MMIVMMNIVDYNDSGIYRSIITSFSSIRSMCVDL